MLYNILHITTVRIWTKFKNPNSKQKFGLPLAGFRMELGGETWWWSVWRRGDSRSVGGSSRSGRGPRRAVDRLVVGIGGDCGKHVLAAAVCVCVCVSTWRWRCWVLTWGWGSDPWGVREGSKGWCVLCGLSLRLEGEAVRREGGEWGCWVRLGALSVWSTVFVPLSLLVLCLYLYWFCASIFMMCAVYVCGVWGCLACGLLPCALWRHWCLTACCWMHVCCNQWGLFTFFFKPTRSGCRIGFHPIRLWSDRVGNISSDRVLWSIRSDPNPIYFGSDRVGSGRIGYFAHP